MSYGMFPFCVQDDQSSRMLYFKRCTGTTEKDRVQRLNDAALALQSCPDIAWYNNSLGIENESPLHVQTKQMESTSQGLDPTGLLVGVLGRG